MATITQSQNRMAAFPEHALTEALRRWWDATVATKRDDPFAAAGTLYDLVVEIDSLTVVDAILAMESVVGFELPVKVIKRGGYKRCEDMLNHLIPAIRALYNERNSTITNRTPHGHRTT